MTTRKSGDAAAEQQPAPAESAPAEDAPTPASQRLSPEAVARLRARLARKYH
jgi:hypothetical protein